jgi:hypothetical protein
MLLMPELSAYRLGQLLAMYEHRTFVEAMLYGINPFDEFGVEYGRTLAGPMAAALARAELPSEWDGSTRALMRLRAVRDAAPSAKPCVSARADLRQRAFAPRRQVRAFASRHWIPRPPPSGTFAQYWRNSGPHDLARQHQLLAHGGRLSATGHSHLPRVRRRRPRRRGPLASRARHLRSTCGCRRGPGAVRRHSRARGTAHHRRERHLAPGRVLAKFCFRHCSAFRASRRERRHSGLEVAAARLAESHFAAAASVVGLRSQAATRPTGGDQAGHANPSLCAGSAGNS